MNRTFFIILISIFLFIGINTVFYFTIFNQQLDFQTDLLTMQTRLCGSTIEQGGLNFENELNAIPFADDFIDLIYNEEVKERGVQNLQKLYSRYSDLINKITVFDNENNVYSLILDRKGDFVSDYYESQEQTILRERDELICEQEKYSLSIPDFDEDGIVRSNIVVEINFARFVNSIFEKYRLENTLWQWMVTEEGALIATAESDLNIPINDLKRIGSEIIAGEESSMIHSIDVYGTPTKVVSVYYPIRLVKLNLAVIFSIKTDLFLRSIIIKITIISLFSLTLIALLLYVYFTVFRVKSETVRRKRVSEVALIKTLDSLPVGMILSEPNGAIRVMNTTAREWIMKDPKDLPEDKSIHELELDTQTIGTGDALYTRAFGPGHVINFQNDTIIRKLYKREWLTEINQVETNIILLFDISEFEKSRNLEKIAHLAKTELLESMSHEIAGPVSRLHNAIEILEKEGLRGKVKETAVILKKTTDLLSNQITSILDFATQNAEKVIMGKIPFSLKDEINLAIQPFKSLAAQTNSSIITKISNDIPDRLVGDPFRLRQILYNLVESSVELTTRGGRILISAEAIEYHDESLIIQFQIDDTGSGLPRDIIDKFVNHQGNTPDLAGEGFEENELRIAIALQHINLLKGHLWIESPSSITSDPDQPGTKYAFTVEVLKGNGKEEDCLSGDTSKASRIKIINSNISILLAEDNIFNRKFAQYLFKSLGFEIDLAENGKEAVKMAAEKSYDIIFMDLLMPEMDGLQAVKEIRKLGIEVPVVAVTAVENPDSRSNAAALGIKDYLLKPATTDQIKEILLHSFPKNALGN
jgi:CheY-like chemotaxis protein/signal transduction histidine kinase